MWRECGLVGYRVYSKLLIPLTSVPASSILLAIARNLNILGPYKFVVDLFLFFFGSQSTVNNQQYGGGKTNVARC